jgi:hypothetical protein
VKQPRQDSNNLINYEKNYFIPVSNNFFNNIILIAKSDIHNAAGLYSGVHYYDSTLSKSTGTKWIVTGMEPMKETLEISFKSAF